MNVKNRLFSSIMVISCFIMISSCATTELNTVWRDDNYSGKIKKVLVIGVIKRPALRRSFEQEFVQQLKTRGTDAVASFTVLAADEEVDKNIIASKLKELNADGVLITRLIDKKTVETYIPILLTVYIFRNTFLIRFHLVYQYIASKCLNNPLPFPFSTLNSEVYSLEKPTKVALFRFCSLRLYLHMFQNDTIHQVDLSFSC